MYFKPFQRRHSIRLYNDRGYAPSIDRIAVFRESDMVHKIAGDVNADGAFNIADVVLLQKWLLVVPDIELKDWKATDLCGDGRLDVFDLCLMRRALLNQA